MSPGKDGGRPLVQKSGIQHRFGGNPAAKEPSRRLAVSAIGPRIRGGGLHTPMSQTGTSRRRKRPQLLLVGDLRLRGIENPCSRDLRCDQECRHHGWKAYQSEKLIHRKHRHRPPRYSQNFKKAASIHPCRSLLRAYHELVGVSRPGNRQQRQNRNDDQGSHGLMVVLDCGQKRQSLVLFGTNRRKIMAVA